MKRLPHLMGPKTATQVLEKVRYMQSVFSDPKKDNMECKVFLQLRLCSCLTSHTEMCIRDSSKDQHFRDCLQEEICSLNLYISRCNLRTNEGTLNTVIMEKANQDPKMPPEAFRDRIHSCNSYKSFIETYAIDH